MFARSTTIQADPARVDEGITYVRDEVMPTIMDTEGCIGISMLVDRTSGKCITTTAWRDEQAMKDSDAQAGPLRARAGAIFGGTPAVDVWEIAALHRMDEAPEGACLRVTWTRSDPSKVDRAIETYRTTMLPAMEDLPGFCSASLFVQRETGRAASSVTYASPQAREQARDAATALRRTAVQENDIEIQQVGEFDLVLAHLHVPETV